MLPKTLKPRVKTELLRVGSSNDGGYVVPRTSLSGTDSLYGLGISTNWDFEERFHEETGAKVICFDHSITTKFWIKYLLKGAARSLILKPNAREVVKRVLKYKEYISFFDGVKAVHNSAKVGSQAGGDTDITQIFSLYPAKNAFIKMDIEGYEYQILDQLCEHCNRLTGLVIEFHDVHEHMDAIVKFVEQIPMHLVHIHGNNFGGVNENGDPNVIELTFKPADASDQKLGEEVRYPIHGLDAPNSEKLEEIHLSFA